MKNRRDPFESDPYWYPEDELPVEEPLEEEGQGERPPTEPQVQQSPFIGRLLISAGLVTMVIAITQWYPLFLLWTIYWVIQAFRKKG